MLHTAPAVFERYPGAASRPLPWPYRRREPETSALYHLVQNNLETFLARAREQSEHGFGYPRFVARTFYSYLDCGILARGFARVLCRSCGKDMFVALSCKCRAVCPSCACRRMNDTAAHLVDRLLPPIPYRQWVLSTPRQVRFMMAVDPTFMGQVQRIFIRAIFADLRRRARKLGIADPRPGAIGFTHLAGSILNLHPHFHCLLTEGVFHRDRTGGLAFTPLRPPSDHDVTRVALKVRAKVRRLISTKDPGFADEQDSLVSARAEAVRAQPLSQLQLFELDARDAEKEAAFEHPRKRRRRCAFVDGFSVHAQSSVKAASRSGLEKLCRYGLRPSFSVERLSLLEDGRVCYRLKRPWPRAGGITQLVLEPLDFLKRLACLIPPPRTNLVRYFGVFAANANERPRLSRWAAAAAGHQHSTGVEPRQAAQRCSSHALSRHRCHSVAATIPGATVSPPTSTVSSTPSADRPPLRKPPAQRTDLLPMPVDLPEQPIRPRRLPWAQLLKRTYQCDVLVCDSCGGKRDIIAFIEDPGPIRKILEHVGLPADVPPIAPARAPPDDELLAHHMDEL